MSNKISADFIKLSNKELLWNVIYEKGLFNDVPEKYLPNVKKDFEITIVSVSQQNSLGNKSLIQLNKTVISEMVKELKKYKHIDEPARVAITAEEVSKQKQTTFKTNLDTLQHDFDTFITGRKPDDINFTDVLDKPIGDEMDGMLANAILLREKELNIVLDKQDRPAIIKTDIDSKEKNTFTDTQAKTDTQAQTDTLTDSFISKLKVNTRVGSQGQDNNKITSIQLEINSLAERIKIIESTQQEILASLKKS